MSGELTTAKTHLAALQNEVTSLRQKEAELNSQLSKVTSEAEKYKNELAHTKDSHTGQFSWLSCTGKLSSIALIWMAAPQVSRTHQEFEAPCKT